MQKRPASSPGATARWSNGLTDPGADQVSCGRYSAGAGGREGLEWVVCRIAPAGAKPYLMADLGQALRDAAAGGDLDAVRAALAAGAVVDARGEYGDTALNVAAESGRADIVAFLIGEGANVENPGGADKTPLMNAAFAGHVAVARQLLAAGARISDDLLNSLVMKVSILEENAESGMVRPEAAQAWRGFLDAMVAERRRQDQR